MMQTLVVERGMVEIAGGNLFESSQHGGDRQARPRRTLAQQLDEIRVYVESSDFQTRIGEELAAHSPTRAHVEHVIADRQIGVLQGPREARQMQRNRRR